MQTTSYVWDVAASLPVILQAKTNGATTSYLYGLDLVSATDNNGVRTHLLQDGCQHEPRLRGCCYIV